MKGSSKLVSLYYYNLIMIKDPNFKDKKSYSIYNNYLSEKQQVKIFNSLNFEDRIKLLDNCKISVRNLAFSQLSVEEKIDILFKVEYKDELLFTQTDNNLVLKMIEKVESFEEKLEIIKKSFKSPLFALKALELIPDSSERNDAINFILFKNEKAKISINELKDEKLISNIFLYNKVYGSVTHKQCEISFERDLNEFNDNVNRKIVVTESSSYVNLDETENTLLTEMKKNNFDVQKNVNPAILDKRYISTLGVDIVNVIACDRELQRQILSLNEKKYEIFCKMFNWYQEKYNLLDWKKLFYEL